MLPAFWQFVWIEQSVPSIIISKDKTDKIERVSDIYVLETEKAWCTHTVIRKWVDLMLPLVLQGGQRGLLVWGSASTHRAKDMKKFLAQRRIDQIMIPAGMAACLQTLDIAINKLPKDHLHREISDNTEHRMDRNKHGNFVKPCLSEVVTWVKHLWDKITDSCVSNALRAGYMDKKCYVGRPLLLDMRDWGQWFARGEGQKWGFGKVTM
ncbi:hypothetical protein Chor_003076 [Crotalus horridus]